MRIAIDASAISSEKITGVENYVRSLILSLSKIDSLNTYFLYSPTAFFNFPKLPINFKLRIGKKGRFWGQTQLPKMINADAVDVAFFPSNTIPLGLNCSKVYHFHDMAWKFFPKAYSASMRLRQIISVKRAKKLADHVITSSSSAKNDLIKYYVFDLNSISVVPFGYNTDLNKYSIAQKDRQGIIFISRLENRKNLHNILEAYKKYADQKSSPEDLILVGGEGYGFNNIIKRIKELNDLGYNIRYKGYLPDEECYKLLGSSRVFLYPSLYEGFGLPILEAFTTQTAVITANTSSMPEVAGEGALIVDPLSATEISEALLNFDNEHTRLEYIEKGTEQLKNFSWDKTAKETIEVLKNVKISK